MDITNNLLSNGGFTTAKPDENTPSGAGDNASQVVNNIDNVVDKINISDH